MSDIYPMHINNKIRLSNKLLKIEFVPTFHIAIIAMDLIIKFVMSDYAIIFTLFSYIADINKLLK